MLLFRSEEHIDRWLDQHGLTRGYSFSLEQCWQLARLWYRDRLDPAYQRRTAAEAEAVFASIALSGDFWRLTP